MTTPDTGCPTISRVLLAELGGATYDVLVPLADSGTMPNMARLLRRSALARLRFRGPASKPVASATLESGGGPGVHGMLDECYLDHRHGRLVAGCPQPPARSTLTGLVSAAYSPSAAQVAETPIGGRVWPRQPATFAELRQEIAGVQAALRAATATVGQIDQSTQWRLLHVRLGSIDPLLGRLWHMLGIGQQAGGNRQSVGTTREAFRTLDDCLGELLELAERRGAALLVVSPYGFAPFRARINLSELLRRKGLFCEVQGTAVLGYRLAHLQWKVRRSLGPKPSWRPLGGLLPVDMRRTRAVSFHGESAALVYLNTPQRFGTRVLTGERACRQAAADVLGVLREARHPLTRQPLFTDIYLTAVDFDCDPLGRLWPDVVAIPAEGFYVRQRPDRCRHLMRADCSHRAARTGEGMLMVHAPQVVLGEPHTAELTDVAPTVLALLGLAPAASMSGRAMTELFQPPQVPALASDPQSRDRRSRRTVVEND